MSEKQDTGRAEIVYEDVDDSIIVTHYPSAIIGEVKIERHDTDEKKSYRGWVSFEDTESVVHKVPIIHKHSLKNMLQRAKTWWDELDDAIDSSIEGDLFAEQTMDIRIATQGEKEWVMPPMSSRWAPITVETLVEPLAEAIGKGNKIHVTPPNGVHGGFIRVSYPGNKLAKYNVCISGGNLLGTKSLRMYAEGRVLACSNLLTALVSQKLSPLVSFRLAERHIHTTAQADLSQMLESVKAVGERFIAQFEKAKDIKLSQEHFNRMVDYYKSVGRLSDRVVEKHLLPAYADKETTQVPDTLYGFAMATSWLGTHSLDLKPGVRRKLNLVAGETILMANQFDEYIDIIDIPTEEQETVAA